MSAVTATVVRGQVTAASALTGDTRVVPLGGVTVRVTETPARVQLRLAPLPRVVLTPVPRPYTARVATTPVPFRVVLQVPTIEIRVDGQLWFNKTYNSGLLAVINGGY